MTDSALILLLNGVNITQYTVRVISEIGTVVRRHGYGRKEGNVLFNNALNTFYLRLYGVRHMVKDHSDNERGNLLPPQATLSD